MRTGKTLHQLAVELQTQQQVKRDYLLDSQLITMSPSLELALGRNGNARYVGLTGTGHEQLSSKLGVPRRFYQHLQEKHPETLSHLVTDLAHREPQKMLVRTLHDNARAFLSDKYRTIDNFDLLNAVLPTLLAQEANVPEIRLESCEVTERKMYIKGVFPEMEGEIKVGDPVYSGFVISNSEIGNGSLRVEHLLWILRCKNGMILPASLRKYHVGKRQLTQELDDAVEVYSEQTQRLDNQALFAKVRDVIKATFNPAEFHKRLEDYKSATEDKVNRKEPEFFEVTAKHFMLTQDEKHSALAHFIRYGDNSRYGLMNAITSMAQDESLDYDRATQLESLGGEILEMSPKDWAVLAG